MCVILSARKTLNLGEDPTLVDKSAILCSLNIKSMTFDDPMTASIKSRKTSGETGVCGLVYYTRLIAAISHFYFLVRCSDFVHNSYLVVVGQLPMSSPLNSTHPTVL